MRNIVQLYLLCKLTIETRTLAIRGQGPRSFIVRFPYHQRWLVRFVFRRIIYYMAWWEEEEMDGCLDFFYGLTIFTRTEWSSSAQFHFTYAI